jgi:hypothetical protein
LNNTSYKRLTLKPEISSVVICYTLLRRTSFGRFFARVATLSINDVECVEDWLVDNHKVNVIRCHRELRTSRALSSFMKKAIIYTLSILVLCTLAFLVYSGWWIERTHEMYAPVYNYISHAAHELNQLHGNNCYIEVDSLIDCIRESRKHRLISGSEIIECRHVLTPSKDALRFGFLIANELALYDQKDLPILVCKTPLASVRREEGDPPGRNHLAGFSQGGFRKMTPEEFRALDRSLYVDVEAIITELD